MQQTTPETVRHVFIPMEQHLTEEASAKNPTVFYACGRNHMQNRKGLRTIFLTEMEMLRARRQSIRVSKNDGRIHCFPRKIEKPFPDEISGKGPPLSVQQASDGRTVRSPFLWIQSIFWQTLAGSSTPV